MVAKQEALGESSVCSPARMTVFRTCVRKRERSARHGSHLTAGQMFLCPFPAVERSWKPMRGQAGSLFLEIDHTIHRYNRPHLSPAARPSLIGSKSVPPVNFLSLADGLRLTASTRLIRNTTRSAAPPRLLVPHAKRTTVASLHLMIEYSILL